MHIVPVILSGGSGTRLWPLSRSGYPKQFMDIAGTTLFGNTLLRATALPDVAPPMVVCNESHRFFAAAILQQLHVQGQIILEPIARNTAPAIALAALSAREPELPDTDGDDPILLVMPSDHRIESLPLFAEAVRQGAICAAGNTLVTFGITPSHPETGFGYIRRGAPHGTAYHVAAFEEKPTESRAQALLAAGDCYWNSGIFMFRASVFLQELHTHAPDIAAACAQAWTRRSLDHDFVRVDHEAFSSSPALSVDYAVMERTREACVVPLAATWSDLGSWSAFYDSTPHDAQDNACVGDVLNHDTKGCYLHGTHRLVAALGVEDLVVVESADAVLVTHKNRCQDVKILLESLKEQGRSEAQFHTRVYRPWGSYEVLAMGERFQVKRIIVKPSEVLSLQWHHHRAEHWVVVSGTAKVTVGTELILLHEDQSTYIPLGTLHRLENPGKIPLEIVEIQSGSYLGEDDIVRVEDTYGRIKK
ncbi:MAG: mannose-1-phosphate guanylyltransferase/mannose-6-phosphate isomerase [Desulfovibrionaceae bacterium]